MARSAWDLETDHDTDWRLAAGCRGYDPEIWSLSVGRHSEDYKLAHKVCLGCPVQQQCEDLAVRTGSWGMIFGGRDFTTPAKISATPLEGSCERCTKRFDTLVAWRRFCSDYCRKLYHAKVSR